MRTRRDERVATDAPSWHYAHTVLDGFTEQAREAIVRAQREASGMGHHEVQVDHLLLGLFSDQQDVVARLLEDFGLSVELVRDLVRRRVAVEPGFLPGEPPAFSPLAKNVLRSAYRFGMGEAGTEHILIVLMARGESACEILRLLEVDPGKLRFETKKRAFPSNAGTTNQVKATARPMLPELDFGE
jgi:ATP-dependent Clp protease ATP-binding subunit ClpC